jgi:hypothetical protein
LKAVILNPGPSLAKLESVPPCDLSIAVNRAAIAFPVQVWAAMDYPTIKRHNASVIGSPSLFTRKQTWDDTKNKWPRNLFKLAEDIAFPVQTWALVTMTCSIMLAAHLGATTIQLFGCDQTGTADFDGAEAGEDRTETRWQRERSVLEEMTVWLGSRGCELIRHAD